MKKKVQPGNPLISCLCVTRNEPAMLNRAITCFINQTYNAKQLIIVYEASNLLTEQFLSGFSLNENIVPVKVDTLPVKLSLGELRNISIEKAEGEYVCQWDDDDWYHPDRLSVQMKHLLSAEKQGCILSRWLIFDFLNKTAYLSHSRLWEGSVLCKKELLKKYTYAKVSKGEDTGVIRSLYAMEQLVIMNSYPELYIYTYHGKNTWERSHFDQICQCSTKLPDSVSSSIWSILMD